jgi:hypothetical protein
MTPVTQLRIDFIQSLTDEAFEMVKEVALFPRDWSRFRVSFWLGAVYNQITLRLVRHTDNNQIRRQYLETWYPLEIINSNTNNYISLNIPIRGGFDAELMQHIHFILLNTHIDNIASYLNYINHGGTRYLTIYVPRYNEMHQL